MRRITILMLVLLIMTLAGCSRKDNQSSEIETAMKEKIAEEAKLQSAGETKSESIISGSDENLRPATANIHLSIPDSYTRAEHNGHIYVYDSNGNSLIISNQSLEMKVAEYSETDYRRLVSSDYKNIELQKFEHITINTMKAIRIEYTGYKNNEKFKNCRYYIENSESTILIDLQAIDKSNYSMLKSVAEEIKF